MIRTRAWLVILTVGMGMAPWTASGAPQVQKSAPGGNATLGGNATNEAVASQGKQAQYLDYLKKSLTQQTQSAKRTIENSPPFQRRESEASHAVPAGDG